MPNLAFLKRNCFFYIYTDPLVNKLSAKIGLWCWSVNSDPLQLQGKIVLSCRNLSKLSFDTNVLN